MSEAEFLNTIGAHIAPLVSKPGQTPQDVVRVASALVASADTILRAVGGVRLAAAIFQGAADRCLDELAGNPPP